MLLGEWCECCKAQISTLLWNSHAVRRLRNKWELELLEFAYGIFLAVGRQRHQTIKIYMCYSCKTKGLATCTERKALISISVQTTYRRKYCLTCSSIFLKTKAALKVTKKGTATFHDFGNSTKLHVKRLEKKYHSHVISERWKMTSNNSQALKFLKIRLFNASGGNYSYSYISPETNKLKYTVSDSLFIWYLNLVLKCILEANINRNVRLWPKIKLEMVLILTTCIL